MKNIVIIAAGGRGIRMGEALCKQFLKLRGKAILSHTISRFHASPLIHGIVIGITPGEEEYLKESILPEVPTEKIIALVRGGSERQRTVFNCLIHVPETCEIVLVHDAVRPFASLNLIARVIQATHEHDAVIPAVSVDDTTKKVVRGTVEKTLNRKELVLVQTPQGFRRSLLVEAYLWANKENVIGTDDASLVEAYGKKVHVVPGEKKNIKITTPYDLELADFLLSLGDSQKTEM